MAGKFAEPRHTARAIIVHEGNLLLMERWRNDSHYFSIPGGGIEAGETAEEAVLREVLEETNLTVEVINLVIEMRDNDHVHKIFLCKFIDGEMMLPAHSPEAMHMSPNNRFKPCWIPTGEVESKPFSYWEPVKQSLLEGLRDGFLGEQAIVTVG